MTELTHTEVNCETGVVTTRLLTVEEIELYEQMQATLAQQMEEQTIAREAEIAALASARTKLTALGLSDEEIEVLAGKALPSSAS